MEKFGILNLLKALETLSPQQGTQNTEQINDNPFFAPPPQTKPERAAAEPRSVNMMASVLERHEQISNRIKNNRR